MVASFISQLRNKLLGHVKHIILILDHDLALNRIKILARSRSRTWQLRKVTYLESRKFFLLTSVFSILTSEWKNLLIFWFLAHQRYGFRKT